MTAVHMHRTPCAQRFKSKRQPHLLCLFLVLAVLVPPDHVLHRRSRGVLLQVVERVLCDVCHAQVGMPLDLARGRLCLAGENLDERRLAGAVGATHSDARRHVGLEGDLRGAGSAVRLCCACGAARPRQCAAGVRSDAVQHNSWSAGRQCRSVIVTSTCGCDTTVQR